MQLLYKKLSPDAVAPKREHDTDAGFDVCSREYKMLAPGERYTFSTGLAVQLVPDQPSADPCSWYLRAADKSGLASRLGITVLGGVIDRGYTGEVKIVLRNTGSIYVNINYGDKICQLVPTLVPSVDSCVEVVDFTTTDRGSAGFGSTGA